MEMRAKFSTQNVDSDGATSFDLKGQPDVSRDEISYSGTNKLNPRGALCLTNNIKQMYSRA